MSHSDPKTCEALLAAMVGFDSVNGNVSGRPDAEAELAAYLESVATTWGLPTRRLPLARGAWNLLTWHEVDPKAPWLLFESHLDTVSVAGMTIDPFAADVREGRMYGRGACDTKGTGAAMLWSLRHLAHDPGANNIALVFTTDEEITKIGIRTFVEDQLPALGWRPQGAVVGEPTLLRPIVAHNGIVRWQIHTEGIAAHAADPERGRSAISMMMHVVNAIESRYAPGLNRSHPLTGKARCTVNIIRGGVQVYVVPDRCTIDLDRRVVPGEDVNDVVPAVEQVLDDLRRADAGLRVRQDEPYTDLPLNGVGSESLVDIVRGILRKHGIDGTPCGAKYGTDASQLAAAGIPVVVMGPGDIAQAHTKDEWIALSQLARGVEVYGDLMRTAWSES